MKNVSTEEGSIKNIIIGLSSKFEKMSRIYLNSPLAKAYTPYNITARSILNNVGEITGIQLRWVYK